MKNSKIQFLAILIICFFFKTSVTAMSPSPPPPTSIPPPVGSAVPINKQISILFLSGILLGAFVLKRD